MLYSGKIHRLLLSLIVVSFMFLFMNGIINRILVKYFCSCLSYVLQYVVWFLNCCTSLVGIQYFNNDDSNNLSSFLLYIFTVDVFTSLYLSPKLHESTSSLNWERHVLDMSLVQMHHYQITLEAATRILAKYNFTRRVHCVYFTGPL